MGTRVKASIVILTHNRLAALTRCVGAIVSKTRLVIGDDTEVWIVDNGSTDGTAEWLGALTTQRGWHAIMLTQNEGVCARNHALRQAQGDFILQVDDDVEVGSGWDQSLLGWFSDPKVGAAGQEGFFLNWAGLLAGPWAPPNFLADQRPAPGEDCDLVMGYCWAWRNLRCADKPCWLYDERFSPHWHEETDLQLQIKAAGYRIRCGPVVATHRSLKDPAAARANDPMIGLHHAADHERLLIEKWGDKRELLRLELDRRGQ
jgi:glycosyltransferase involved in cell wall biosynthesis